MAFSNITTYIDDYINPIAVKEMRQAVKGKSITWVLLIFLAIQLCIIGSVLVISELATDFNLGRGVFMSLLGVLLGTCLLFIPTITALRLSAERSNINVDLVFITTLRPSKIIWGKFTAAMSLVLLFYSACAPFMTLTYMFRGLDLPTIFVLIALSFIVVTLCIQFSILLACLPGNLVIRGIYFIVGIGVLIFALWATMAFSSSMIFFGMGAIISGWQFWGPALLILTIVALLFGLMFTLSVALISPPSSNRIMPIRFYLLFTWLVTGGLVFGCAFYYKIEEFIEIWVVVVQFVLAAVLFLSIAERQIFGPRIRRKIPKNILLRITAFLSYTGSAGGILFSISLMAISLLAAIITSNLATVFSFNDEAIYYYALPISLYSIAYALVAVILTNIFRPKNTKPMIPLLILTFLMVAGTVIPTIFGFMLRKNAWYDIPPRWFMGNPFIVFFERNMTEECILMTSIISIIAAIILTPWFVRQFKRFKPFELPKPLIQVEIEQQPITKAS